LGEMTSQTLEHEVADWVRFQNRGQVAGYTRLCAREYSSGARMFKELVYELQETDIHFCSVHTRSSRCNDLLVARLEVRRISAGAT